MSRSNATSTAPVTFPWVVGGVLYSVSWGLGLLKPNTYFWDDWAFIYNQPYSHMNEYFVDTGLPPWRAILDRALIEVGPWTLRVLTLVMMFLAAWLAVRLVETLKLLDRGQLRMFAIFFLVVPTFAARIALVMFGYTTSWFLFLLAWWMLATRRSWWLISLAIVALAWSLMTHSLLLFAIVPVVHLLWLSLQAGDRRRRVVGLVGSGAFALLPPLYLLARSRWWAPLPEWTSYHSPTLDGLTRGGVPILVLLAILLARRNRRTLPQGDSDSAVWILLLGTIVFFAGLFPYLLNASSYNRYVDVFAFRSDWGNRNQLLLPLGAALFLVGALSMVPRPVRRSGCVLVVGLCVGLNAFVGVQFHLDAVKREQIRDGFGDLVATSADLPPLVVVDLSKRFNGKGSSYRSFEVAGLAQQAGLKNLVSTKEPICEAPLFALPLYVESDRSFLEAAISGDPSITIRVGRCTDGEG